MKNSVLRAQSALYDLQKFTSKENVITSLVTLNEIISNREEIDFLYKSNGINVIMTLLGTDNELSNICLKILANASVRNKKIRGKLLENNIFHLLAAKLQNETDFSMKNLIFYSSLIVALVQGNYEAQDQLRTSGCLSSITYIMSSLLDGTESESATAQGVELIIYLMIASSKEPRHQKNQTEIGWIIPKILEYLGKQNISAAGDKLEIIKCYWSFLRIILDKNELNQQIFTDSFGLSIIFSTIQEILDERKCPEMYDLLVKITGVLVKLKSHTGFLCQASNYCPLMILCSLLKTCNILVMVVQQTIIFLESLSRESPNVLQLMRTDKISKQIKKTNFILLKNRVAAELCRNLWNRLLFDNAIDYSQNGSNNSFGCSLESVNSKFRQIHSEPTFGQQGVCVVHDADQLTNFQCNSDCSPNSTIRATKKITNENLSKIKFSESNLNFHRKIPKERGKQLKKTITRHFFPSQQDKGTRFNKMRKRIVDIFRKLLSFFLGMETYEFNNILQQ